MERKSKKSVDVKAWYLAPHCGPGTDDPSKVCGFCGENVLECAKEFTQHIKDHPDYNHDGSELDDGQDDPERVCGGSGFWCSQCGRFWAQDSCGESYMPEPRSADGKYLTIKDGLAFCVCDKQLAVVRKAGD